jgi:hypothetical protein
MIPIDKIEVLNPRDRNGRVFDEIVGNIKSHRPEEADHGHATQILRRAASATC